MTRLEQQRNAGSAFQRLRRFAHKPEPILERCHLCNVGLAPSHPHLLESGCRHLVCACEGCATLFTGRSDVKFQRVPHRIRQLSRFQIADAEWNALMIPINLAFFVRDSHDLQVHALYPSPAGATESLLTFDAWDGVSASDEAIREMETDVEALLVNRVGYARQSSPAEYYIVPIDVCYQLVGLIRIHWKGLSGGTEVWREIATFFAGLRAKAEIPSETFYA